MKLNILQQSFNTINAYCRFPEKNLNIKLFKSLFNKKAYSRMHTAHLLTALASVATRCQYWEGGRSNEQV